MSQTPTYAASPRARGSVAVDRLRALTMSWAAARYTETDNFWAENDIQVRAAHVVSSYSDCDRRFWRS